MKIGIISDTHDHHAHVLEAIDILNEQDVDVVLHAGDIVSPFTLRAFTGLKKAKLIVVLGNNDGEKLFLNTTAKDTSVELEPYCYRGELDGKNVYMTHMNHDIEDVIATGQYDLVVYGHTHQQDIRWVDNTLVINPGECTDWITGQSSLVILDTADMSYQVVSIN